MHDFLLFSFINHSLIRKEKNMEFVSQILEKFQYKKLSSNDDVNNGASVECGEEKEDDNRISSWKAFWNVCNSIQGVAILAMPYLIKGGGIWSIFTMIVVAAISNYTGQILIKCHYDEAMDEESGDIINIRKRFCVIYHVHFTLV